MTKRIMTRLHFNMSFHTDFDTTGFTPQELEKAQKQLVQYFTGAIQNSNPAFYLQHRMSERPKDLETIEYPVTKPKITEIWNKTTNLDKPSRPAATKKKIRP